MSKRLSPFQRQVARDFKTTFLNVEEFGRFCDWNGRRLQIVEGASPPIIESDFAPGILQNAKDVYCRRQDMRHPPKANEAVMLDGERWQVVDVKKLVGHYIITLSRASS